MHCRLAAATETARREFGLALGLLPEEMLARGAAGIGRGSFETVKLTRKRAGGIHHGQGSLTPRKAEYIGADQTVILSFRLQLCGGPYIPISGDIVSFQRLPNDAVVLRGRVATVGGKGCSRQLWLPLAG